MTNRDIAIATAVIMSTLLECDWAPRSIVQMALAEKWVCFRDVHIFNQFCGVLEGMGWIKVSAERLTLTDDGRIKAQEFEAMRMVGE